MCEHIHQCLGSQGRKLLGVVVVYRYGWFRAGEAAAVLGGSVFWACAIVRHGMYIRQFQVVG